MKRIAILAVIGGLLLSMLACGPISALTGGGATQTTVTELWSDVPRMDGMTVSDLEVPPYVHLLLGIVSKQVLGQGQDAGDWIDFTTDKTPDDVKAFYTPALMADNGWDKSDKSTCLTGADQGVPQVGAFCVFQKHVKGQQIGLMIVATQDEKTKKTNVFFVRVTVVDRTPTPKP